LKEKQKKGNQKRKGNLNLTISTHSTLLFSPGAPPAISLPILLPHQTFPAGHSTPHQVPLSQPTKAVVLPLKKRATTPISTVISPSPNDLPAFPSLPQIGSSLSKQNSLSPNKQPHLPRPENGQGRSPSPLTHGLPLQLAGLSFLSLRAHRPAAALPPPTAPTDTIPFLIHQLSFAQTGLQQQPPLSSSFPSTGQRRANRAGSVHPHLGAVNHRKEEELITNLKKKTEADLKNKGNKN